MIKSFFLMSNIYFLLYGSYGISKLQHLNSVNGFSDFIFVKYCYKMLLLVYEAP